MPAVQWRDTVASLLEDVAKALVAQNDRRAVVAIGTALAYLEKARMSGDAEAGYLLTQLRQATQEDRTARFQFIPGELEELKSRRKKE
jgi:hypothetical protein